MPLQKITSTDITSVSNTIISGTITGSQISANTISNTAFQTGSVENYMNSQNSQLGGMRNKIINGAMMIDQRNAGAAVTVTGANYTLDRWLAFTSATATSKFSVQQSSTAPAGFAYSLKATSLSAYSIGASEICTAQQIVEGYNIADFGFGTANAKSITVSFWCRSSLTGTFTASFFNNGQSRWYLASFTISAADTWQYVTITVPGDTGGTWNTTNDKGMYFSVTLSCGSSFQTSASSAWSGGSTMYGITGQQSLVGTNGATFYITGVQLEKGATATPFENRLYGTELALCQRYFQKIPSSGSYALWSSYGATYNYVNWQFKVSMRTAPTIAGGTQGTVGELNNEFASSYAAGSNYAVFGYSSPSFQAATASAEL